MIEFVPSLPSQTNQLVLIHASDWSSNIGSLDRYEIRGGRWFVSGEPTPVNLGSGGLAWGHGLIPAPDAVALKREGDKKTPAGLFRIGAAFGLAQTKPEGLHWPYQAIDSGWVCVDDSRSSFYNRVVSLAQVQKDWSSAEEMAREDGLYKWVINIEHNFPDTKPGEGSCIFFHVWRGSRKPTDGCVSMEEKNIINLLSWLNPSDQPLVAILPQDVLGPFKASWGLMG